MTTALPTPGSPDLAPSDVERSEIVVTIPDGPGRTAAATLSCRLHGVIAGARERARLTVVVEAGDRADEPDLARVLTCAHECATSRGLGFVVR